MFNRAHAAWKRTVRPALDLLESRELLSTASVHLHAETHALRTHSQANVSLLAQLPVSPSRTASTVPANGDQNPYSVAFVPRGAAGGGVLRPGDLLVGNFNNALVQPYPESTPTGNLQGLGTTIVRVAPDNSQTLFYQGPPGVGFANGLAVLKNGLVIAGTVPSTDGTPATAGQGEILVLSSSGRLLTTFSNRALLNGPWGMTVVDHGDSAQVYVSNVLSGTVSRFDVSFKNTGAVPVASAVQIGSGFAHRGDPAAFEVGPGGLAYDAATGNLYVASEADDSIYAIPNAAHTRVDHGTGDLVVHDEVNLHGPIGLTLASNGHLITANSDGNNARTTDPSTLVEYGRGGRFFGKFSIDRNNGAAFAVSITPGPRPFLAATNDVTGTVTTWQIHGTRPIAPPAPPAPPEPIQPIVPTT